MFNKKRFETQAVAAEIDPLVRLILWESINNVPKKDYLQVFKLSRIDDVLFIKHTQEQPEYAHTITLDARNLLFDGHTKLYAIDSGEYSTLMYANEY